MSESIGSRLKQERNSLGYTQAQFCTIAGVKPQSQVNYEKDKRSPDAKYLSLIAEAGADIQYIITGQHALNLNPNAIKKLQHPDNSKEWRFVGDFLGFINLIMEKK